MTKYKCNKCRRIFDESEVSHSPNGVPLCPLRNHTMSSRLRIIRDEEPIYFEL